MEQLIHVEDRTVEGPGWGLGPEAASACDPPLGAQIHLRVYEGGEGIQIDLLVNPPDSSCHPLNKWPRNGDKVVIQC